MREGQKDEIQTKRSEEVGKQEKRRRWDEGAGREVRGRKRRGR